MSRRRVLLLTAAPLLGEALARGLELCDPLLQVVYARPEADVLAQVRRARPDLVLVDLRLPQRTRQPLLACADDGSAPSVLLLAAPATTSTVLAGLEAGAAGVVLLDGGLDEAAALLRAALVRGVAVPDRLFGPLLAVMVQRRRRSQHAASLLDLLSAREREVLDLLVQGSDHHVIAAALVISPQTARTHIARVLAKLQVHSRLEAVALTVRLDREGAGVPG